MRLRPFTQNNRINSQFVDRRNAGTEIWLNKASSRTAMMFPSSRPSLPSPPFLIKIFFPFRRGSSPPPLRELDFIPLALSLAHTLDVRVNAIWGPPLMEALSVKVFVYRKLYPRCARTEKSVPLARSLRDFPLRESRCFSVECSIVSDTCARFVDTKEK